MMTEREDIAMELEVDTSEGKRHITLRIKPLARCLGCVEINMETATLVKNAIERPLTELMVEVNGRSEYEVEKAVNRRAKEAPFGSIEEEFYRQVALELQKLRVASPAAGGAPPTDAEMAMLIETFLNYPGMDSSCLLALSVAAAKKSFDLDIAQAGLPSAGRALALDMMTPTFAKAIQAYIRKGVSTLEAIKAGREAKAMAEDLVSKLKVP